MDDKYLVKISLYRHILETEFNFSFGHTKNDTCSLCDARENSAEHKQNCEYAFGSQKVDMLIPTRQSKMSLQQTMPLLKLSTSKVFYFRQNRKHCDLRDSE